MPNDSRKPGILAPFPDKAVDIAAIHDALVSVSGIDGSLVRARWQLNPPPMPDSSTNWIAFSFNSLSVGGIPEIDHSDSDISDPEAANSTARIRQEMTVRVSCFGADGLNVAESIRAGLSMPFNNVALQSAGMTMLYVDPQLVRSPDIVNGRWVDKWDVSFKIGRMANRKFNVRSIASADFSVINDKAKKLNG